jgi:acetate kinase
MAAMGGLDALLFGGGIGEGSAEVRSRVCKGLAWAGLDFDGAANEKAGEEAALLARPESRVKAWMIRVDEEALIARDVAATLQR